MKNQREQNMKQNVRNDKYQASLFQLISAQTWHVNGALPTLKCNQNTLPSKLLYQGDIEAYRKDSDVPFP